MSRRKLALLRFAMNIIGTIAVHESVPPRHRPVVAVGKPGWFSKSSLFLRFSITQNHCFLPANILFYPYSSYIIYEILGELKNILIYFFTKSR